MDSNKNYYQTLGLSKNADLASIRNAYSTLLKRYHPDTFIGSKKFASDMILEANEAYEVLSDQSTRKQYDDLYVAPHEKNVKVTYSQVTNELDTKFEKSGVELHELASIDNLGAWKRFWARSIDTSIYNLIAIILLLLIPTSTFVKFFGGAGLIFLMIIVILFYCVFETLLFAIFGNTLGKRLLGIYLSQVDKTRNQNPRYFERALLVYVKGCAFGIPPISFLTKFLAKKRLESKGVTSWDEELKFQVNFRPINIKSMAIFILILIIFTGICLALVNPRYGANDFSVKSNSDTAKPKAVIDDIRKKYGWTQDKSDLELVDIYAQHTGLPPAIAADKLGVKYEYNDPNRNPLMAGISSGIDDIQGLLYSATAGIGDMVGSQDIKNWGLRGASQNR
jgi:hypothetical protein